MGQLIKLQDYISRYEQDIYRYPLQFVRLKQQQWNKIKRAYEDGDLQHSIEEPQQEEPKTGTLQKVKQIFSRGQKTDELPDSPQEPAPIFPLRLNGNAENLDDLKQHFLNQLLGFQLKWASSTMHERSFLDQRFYLEERLRFFLQRLPDTCLILYKPVFLLKKAPVEAEVILLTPTEVWCLAFLEDQEDAAFTGSSERFWTCRRHRYPDKKVLNPMISANRMESIVKPLFALYETELPVHKAVLSRNGYIDYPGAPFDMVMLDKRSFPEWFRKIRNQKAPLKHQQLKSAQALLDYCQTTSSLRGPLSEGTEEYGGGPSSS